MNENGNEIKIGYIVLHYQTVDETLECVEALKKISKEKDIIIIVDNHSPNESGKLLCHKFQYDTNIKIILNSENLGFARGNNVGFLEAKYNYHCDFILMLNNDTLVLQEDFREKIISAYEKWHFAVMGPKILQKDGTVNKCSPTMPIHTTLRRARIGQLSNYIRFVLSIFSLDAIFGQLVDKMPADKGYSDCCQEDVQISGCCFIFSKEYIDRFEGLNSETFMYLEEIILYMRIKKEGLKMIYNPELEIVHLEDMATRELLGESPVKQRRFKYKCQMRSFRALIKEIENIE